MLQLIKKNLLAMMPKHVAGRLRIWRQGRLIGAYQPRVVQHVYGGISFTVFLSDGLAEGWYDHDWPEQPDLTVLQGRVKPDAIIFDCGAHQGVVAMMMAKTFGCECKVIAVEPNSHNVIAIRRNLALNNVTRIEVVEAAISDEPGTLTFNQGLNGQIDDGTGKWGSITVAATTVDELASCYGAPAVVFLDVEGAECLALKGASETLKTDADFLIEVHVSEGLTELGGSISELFAHFPTDRYEVLGRREGGVDFQPIRETDEIVLKRFFLLARAKRV